MDSQTYFYIMLNIFNLFLFLFALWVLFMISAGNISWLYVIFGIFAAATVSIFSYRLKIIEEKSELLYLSLGFYRHFFKLYFGNFFSGLKLIITFALTSKDVKPSIFAVDFDSSGYNPALLMTSYNMSSGLFCIGHKGDTLFIHSIDDEYFKKFNLKKTVNILKNVNDDNLV